MALDDETHVVIHVVELLAIVYRLVAVIDGASTFAKMPVLSTVREGGDAGSYAIAEGKSRRGEGVDGQVLGVAGMVPAVEGEDGVCESDEEREGDERWDDEGLYFELAWFSIVQSKQHRPAGSSCDGLLEARTLRTPFLSPMMPGFVCSLL